MSAAETTPDRLGGWEPSSRTAGWALAGVSLVALGLRLHRLGTGLWLDEIAPLLLYGDLSPVEVLTSYRRPNNHLLNTLAVNLSTSLLGAKEWAIRLPAALLGTATVPVTYWLARRSLGRARSLAAGLLVAVSYHHVFFSQNARGYAGYLLFSLAASGCLLRLLEDGRGRWAGAYVAAMLLAMASIPLAGFVLAGHLVVGGGVVVAASRRGEVVGRRVRLASWALAAAGGGGILLYAPVLRQMLATVSRSFVADRIGFSFTSHELVVELARGLSRGLGAGVLLGGLAVAGVAGVGLVAFARRDAGLASALALPELLTVGALAAAGATFYPRFFLLALPLGLLALVHGLSLGARAATRRGRQREAVVFGGMVAAVAAISTLSLASYYRVPKQAYGEALELLEREAEEGAVAVVLDTATGGFRWYARRSPLVEGRDLIFARTEEELATALRKVPVARARLVTTFPASLRHRFPVWSACLAESWEVEREFPASVAGGEIRVWRPRQAGTESTAVPRCLRRQEREPGEAVGGLERSR